MVEWHEREQEPRRWRKFPDQPKHFFDWPCREGDDDKRYRESPADPIICYDSCNGYSIWHEFDPAPPAQMWIVMPNRPAERRRKAEKVAA